MNIIIVADVFGVTPALLEISAKLGDCSIVDPYKSQIMAFHDEAQAYSYFIKNVGLDKYLSDLTKAVASIKNQITLIGFSVGASVIWRLSEQKDNRHIKQAFCFYGSQIRNFTQIDPSFTINLVFPNSEPHFDVVALQKKLSVKVNVKTEKIEYLHGFMNYYSTNFDHSGYKKHLNILCSTASE